MLKILDQFDELRPTAEQAIRAIFDREHGATLHDFPPTLAAWLDGDEILATASLRFAKDGFFSECYLDMPVERLIERKAGIAVKRSEIVEVGSLAAPRPGATLGLVEAIIDACYEGGCRWAFFTATARLRALLRRSGVVQIELAPALPERVPAPETWGQYYLADPRVVAVGAHMLRGRYAQPLLEANHG